MSIELLVIDDLKTERKDVAPPLPAIARLVPLFFYLSLLGAIGLTGVFTLHLTAATKARDEWIAKQQEDKKQLATIQAERKTLEGQAKRASDLEKWTESARSLQPLIIDIIRNIEADSSITDLQMSRKPEDPKQFNFSIKLNTSSILQLDRLLTRLQERGFRTFSPEQKMTRTEIDYKTTLIWQPAAP